MEETLTEEQVTVFKEAFSLFATSDSNGYETLGLKELKTVLQSLGANPTKSEMEQIVGELDSNNDGKINCDEFLLFMDRKMKEMDRKDKIQETFRIFDKHNDGFITPAEIRNVMLNLGEKLSDEEIDDMLRVANVEQDGKINYEEFVKVIGRTV